MKDDSHSNELFKEFESLGNNCEFGLVQRHFGLETVGLLRWGSFPSGFSALRRALQLRLKNAGAEVTLHISGSEYISHDSTHGITFHTHRLVGSIEPDVLIRSERGRIRYLANTLVEDIEDGSKIFVFKSTPEISRADAEALKSDLDAIGPATLLWTTVAEHPGQVGTVELISPRFLRGYINRFAPQEDVNSDRSNDVWLEICRKALSARDDPDSVPKAFGPHRFWRIHVTAAGTQANDIVAIGRLELHDSCGGPNLATEPDCWQASSVFPGPEPRADGYDYKAHNVVSGSGRSDLWAAAPGFPNWVAYDFGSTPKTIREIKLTSRAVSPEQSPRNFALEWSDDNVLWTAALVVQGATWKELQSRTYDICSGSVVAFPSDRCDAVTS